MSTFSRAELQEVKDKFQAQALPRITIDDVEYYVLPYRNRFQRWRDRRRIKRWLQWDWTSSDRF